jgi:hypothetical protein
MAVQEVSVVQPQWVQEVLNSYATDSHAQQLLAQLSISSPDDKGYSLQQGLIKYKNRLWIGANTALQTKLIAACHSSPIGGHSGVKETYQRLKSQFSWKGMKVDVDSFVKQCGVCQHNTTANSHWSLEGSFHGFH